MTDTIPAGTETAAAHAPGQVAPVPTDPAETPPPSEADAAYQWITGLPLGRTRESTASDAPPRLRPARAIAFGA
jgi:hypothetical protein